LAFPLNTPIALKRFMKFDLSRRRIREVIKTDGENASRCR